MGIVQRRDRLASPNELNRLLVETSVTSTMARPGGVATSRVSHGRSYRIRISKGTRARTAGAVDAGRGSNLLVKQMFFES